jgi:hypothetical protein
MNLKSRLILRFLIVIAVFGALLFIPDGSLRFWQDARDSDLQG